MIFIGFSIAFLWWKVETTPPSEPESPDTTVPEIPDELAGKIEQIRGIFFHEGGYGFSCKKENGLANSFYRQTTDSPDVSGNYHGDSEGFGDGYCTRS